MDVILYEMLQVHVDSVAENDGKEEGDETAESVSRKIYVWSASELFQLVGEEGQENRYQAIWSNKLQLGLIVSYVSIGTFFRQASSLLLLAQ